MQMQHWVFLAVIMAIGYALGVMYPGVGTRLGL